LVTGRSLDVYLDGRFCGRLTQANDGNVTFEYDSAYRASDDATPLSLSMPLTAAVYKKRAVLPYLQGLLPDSNEALQAIARRFSVSANNPFALLEHVGVDAAGAIQLVPSGETASDAVLKRTRVRRVDDEEVATMLSRVVSEYAEGAPYYDAAGRFSLAGAQPKIALHKLPDSSWGVPEDATPTTHILKPVAGAFRRIDVVEQMTMHAAEVLGNRVASSELVRIGEWDVLVSERYDRVVVNGQWRRLHQEDLCQALSVPPSKKYQRHDGGPGVAHVAALVRSLPLTADRRLTGEAFYRALVFNVIAGCTDAHAKNYSLMLEQRSVRLAPLYDLLSYAAYWDGLAHLDSAMSVAGEYQLNRISPAKLEQTGTKFGIDRGTAAEIVDATRKGVYTAFESARATVEAHGDPALAVADELLRGLRKLPLVVT
jgi:serine/threonine-protein kinase HipA